MEVATGHPGPTEFPHGPVHGAADWRKRLRRELQ